MSKMNYPVKYSVLNPIELTKRSELCYTYDVVGYFVSKVYVVGETVRYFDDGTSKKQYQIVFPYLNRTELLQGQRHVPEYDYDGTCSNARCVSEIFDSYEEAKQASDYMYLQYGCDGEFEEYQDFETELFEATDDMKTANDLRSFNNRVLVKR